MSVHIKLKEIANKKRIGQSRLSRKADMDLRAIQRLWSKPHTNITLATLEKLARALEVEIGDLIELDPPLEKTAEQEEETD